MASTVPGAAAPAAAAGGGPGVTMTVTVQAVRDLSPQRSGADAAAGLLASAAFGGLSGPDGAEVELAAGASEVSLEYTAEFALEGGAVASIEQVANHRLRIELRELHKPEKKKKDKETVVTLMGVGSVDLQPLLSGETQLALSVPLRQPTAAAGGDGAGANADADAPPAELGLLDVVVELSGPLITPAQLETGSLVTLAAPTIFSVPDAWLRDPPGGSGPCVYSLMVPLTSAEGTRSISIPGGQLITTPLAEDAADALCAACADTSGEDESFVRGAMLSKARVEWPTPVKVFLPLEAQQQLERYIARAHVLPVEVRRCSVGNAAAKGGKARKGGEAGGDDNLQVLYHGVSFVRAAPLVYPGATELAGVYPVRLYNETEVLERTGGTKLRGSDDDAPAHAAGAGAVKGGKKKDKDSSKDGAGKKEGSAAAADEAAPEKEACGEARTFMVFNLATARPLVRKRSREELAQTVAKLIPPRPPFSRLSIGADRAVAQFHAHSASAGSILLDEYRKLLGQEPDLPADKLRQRLLYELNTSGKYHAFKEQLKRSAIKVAREKFQKTGDFASADEHRDFLNRLYVFLVEEMQKSLSNTFSFSHMDETPKIALSSAQLQFFAKEAEARGDMDVAARYFQERTVVDADSAESWYDYGCFCARMGDFAKADECLREAISIQQDHIPSLLMAAIVSWRNSRANLTKTFFEAATSLAPQNRMAWTVRALYHTQVDDTISADMCRLHASKLGADRSKDKDGKTNILLEAASFFLNGGDSELTERALAQNLITNGMSSAHVIVYAKFLLQQTPPRRDEAALMLQAALETDHKNADLWIMLGHALYGSDAVGARQAFEHAIDLPSPSAEESFALLKLGSLYLAEDMFAEAKETFLRACVQNPSATSWQGVGHACYRLGNFEDALDALAESNIYDNTNPEVWAFLTLVCVRTGRELEAEQSYKYCRKLGLADAELLDEIHAEQAEAGITPPFVDAARS